MKICVSLFLLISFSTICISQTQLVTVTFTIVDFDTKKEIIAASVTIRQTGLTQPTLSGGKVQFDNIPIGEIEYHIVKDGYRYKTDRVNVSNDKKSNYFRIEISKDYKKTLVTGKVKDADGKNVEDALVEIKAADKTAEFYTDKSGNYFIELNFDGDYSVNNLWMEVKKGDCSFNEIITSLPRDNVLEKNIILICKKLNNIVETSKIVCLAELRNIDKKGNMEIHPYSETIGNVSVFSEDTRLNFRDDSARILPSEHYDNVKNRGTSIIFTMDKTEFKMLSKIKPLRLRIQMTQVEKDKSGKERKDIVDSGVKIISNGYTDLGESAIKFDDPILFNSPERLTITIISRIINETLDGVIYSYTFDSLDVIGKDPLKLKFIKTINEATHKDSTYIRAIALLDSYMAGDNGYKILSSDQIDDLLNMYIYTKSYLDENSFYNQEARQLKIDISKIEADSTLSKNDTLLTFLYFSQEAYYTYIETYETLLYHHNRVSELLFKNRVRLLGQEDGLFILQKGKKNDLFDQNSIKSLTSFGAFIVPARFRLGKNAKFTSDLTIGASIHYSILKSNRIDLVAGVGLSSVTVDSAKIDNIGSRFTAFTQSIGFSFAPSEGHFQIGIFSGLDIISGNIGNKWDHQGQFWVALGATYRLKKQHRKPQKSDYLKPLNGKYVPFYED